jgi:hypothetical protein
MESGKGFCVRCPKCERDDWIQAIVTLGVDLHDGGHVTPENGAIYWDEASDLFCTLCEYEATGAAFVIDCTLDAELAKSQTEDAPDEYDRDDWADEDVTPWSARNSA